ncbi:undecaprenyl-diphosphate phosphatase [Roseospirillum parvum]|uniref:Undecaprenyl-diphosphatase n=1 Tax=Roseospirillum parvum TaxID=83401 RepID=A0A1G7V5X3_9PROT|nr:undecaprenyl-diphosphate phosphatase [Roseospirillum parvum]SDG55174.1 undecaprenyl-diphosphatase [Roseospirillum parvum]
MSLLQIVVLAVVQGITEFLPISSSGHLILVPVAFDWPDQGVLLDVAVHVGTLVAVMIYFWRDVGAMLAGLGRLLRGKFDPGARLAAMVVLGTLPVVGAGLALKDMIGDDLRSLTVIGWTTLGFGIALWLADRAGMTVRRVDHLTWRDALLIGLAQCLALVPGTSRAGITMTAARVLGYERADSARFSMLLSIPTILAAGTLAGLEVQASGDLQLSHDMILAGALSCLVALAAIALMMAWLKHAGFTPFVLYRIALGSLLLWIAYAG